MASKFRRNRAPGWSSSEEEEISDEGEATSSDEDSDDPSSSKRSRTNDQVPNSMPDLPKVAGDGRSLARKVNNIWGEVLVDQQLSSGLVAGVNVLAKDTLVPRGSESYSCMVPKETAITDSERAKGKKDDPKPEETMDKEEGDDDLFSGDYTEAPDMMANLSATRGKPCGRTKFGDGSRKRPWPRGGNRRWSRDGGGDESGDNQWKKEYAQVGDRGRGRGQWRGGGRGRGRGNFDGDRPRRLEKISLNKDDSPRDIALAISKALRELKTQLMIRAVENIGVDAAIRIYNETVDIENAGGKLTLDGRRRRTSGGVFLFLVRDDPEITEAQKETIFGADREDYRQHLLAKRRFQKKPEEGESITVEPMEDEKPLKGSKEVFLEEALKQPKSESGGYGKVELEDDQMD